MTASKNTANFFKIAFADKSVWHQFKEDLKNHFKEIGVKYLLSEKMPHFYLLYESKTVKCRIDWKDDGVIVSIEDRGATIDERNKLSEIYDLLILFKGQLKEGLRPEKWK